MNRRAFLASLAALVIAPKVVAPPAAVQFRPDAFVLAMGPLEHFDDYDTRLNMRLDVLYGFTAVRPDLACRVSA